MGAKNLGLAAFILVGLSASAEIKQQRGRDVIDEAVAALGGERFLAMRERVEAGTSYTSWDGERFSAPTRTKIYTTYLDRPPKPGDLALRERQAFGKGEYRSLVFADGAGSEITWRGTHPVSNDVLERYRRNTLTSIFYILRERLDEPDLTFDYRGTTVRDNQIVETVDIRDAQGWTGVVYFHHATKLPVRQVWYSRDPETKDKIEEVTVFSRYQDVGAGVMWPFRIERERDGVRIFEMSLDSVTIR